MNQNNPVNHRIVLASRPVGAPTAANFRLEECDVPVPSPGQVLTRTLYLSLDPYMRGRMSDAPSYAAPLALGEVMVGGTVGRVAVSQHPDYQAGDLVLGYGGWQDYALAKGADLETVRTELRARLPDTEVLTQDEFWNTYSACGYDDTCNFVP